MNSKQFDQSLDYLRNKGYTDEQLNNMTLGEIILATEQCIAMDKTKGENK